METKSERAAREAYVIKLAGLEKSLEATRTQLLTDQARSMLPETSKYLLAAWDYSHQRDSGPKINLSKFARTAALKEYALRQWVEILGSGEFRILGGKMKDIGGFPGVYGYQNGANPPNATINATNEARKISTLTLPAKSLSVHPGPSGGVALSWVSPVSGEVEVGGKATDADPNCGDGIAWSIVRRRPSGVVELASGEFANGGQQNFAEGKQSASLKSISVRAGDRIELQILPKGDYFCDTTVIDFVIREKAGVRFWDVTKDVLNAGQEAANPFNDGYGNSAIWNFSDMIGNSASSIVGAGKPAFDLWKRLSSALDSFPEESRRAKMATLADAFQREFQAIDSASPFWISRPEDETALSESARTALKTLRAERDILKKSSPPPVAFANAAQEGGVPESPHAGTHDVKVHIRGRYDRLGDLVPRRFPIVIAGESQPPISGGSGRLELADWIASPTHPLTARVIVNRVWQGHFGQGIVRTPSNFGFLGERPTNPALLDWLASEFTAEMKKDLAKPSDSFSCGWSIKRLHRLIMLSNAYQRSSEASPVARVRDADNRLFGRMNRRRLEAEEIRDSLLSASGTLDAQMGGVAFREMNLPRRTVYLMTIRSDRTGFGTLFDTADSNSSSEKRGVSTVAPQALFLLNNSFILSQAQKLSKRLMAETPGDLQGIQNAYLILYGRPASPTEIQIGHTFLEGGESSQALKWEAYCQILLCANEFLYVD